MATIVATGLPYGASDRRWWRAAGSLLLGAMFLLAACGGSANANVSGGAGKLVPLVVYSAQGYDKATVDAFQKKTGIPTKLVDDSTGPLLSRIQAEKNNPQWGLLWVDGNFPFASLDQQHLLARGYEPNVTWNAPGKTVVPKDQSYVPTGITLAGALVYDSTKVGAPPASWQDLTSARYRGKVGMDNPSISGPTYPLVAGMMSQLGGVSQGEKYFTDLKSNGLVINPTNGDTLHAMQTGQVSMAMIQSSAIFGAIQSDPSLKIAFLPKVTLLPSNIGIDAKAPKQEQAEARRFAAFVLSSPGQQIMQTADPAGDSLYWPVLQSVQPLKQLPPLASAPYQTIDPGTWGGREASINQWFTTNIVSS